MNDFAVGDEQRTNRRDAAESLGVRGALRYAPHQRTTATLDATQLAAGMYFEHQCDDGYDSWIDELALDV